MCSGQQQIFRVKPKDSEVGQGGVAIIACEVANRRGRVQWTKDGLTLGKKATKLFISHSLNPKISRQSDKRLQPIEDMSD